MILVIAVLTAVIDPVELVDKASTQSDRWLFLAAIVFIQIINGIIIRWLVRNRDKELAGTDAERVAHAKWVETVYTENVKLTAQVLVVLQETNTMLKKVDNHFNE